MKLACSDSMKNTAAVAELFHSPVFREVDISLDQKTCSDHGMEVQGHMSGIASSANAMTNLRTPTSMQYLDFLLNTKDMQH